MVAAASKDQDPTVGVYKAFEKEWESLEKALK